MSRSNILGKQLCEAFKGFFSAQIPWHKLHAIKLRSFIEEKLGIKIPDKSLLHKKYLDQQCSDNALQEIGTTYATGQYVANVLAGRLDSEAYHQPFRNQLQLLREDKL